MDDHAASLNDLLSATGSSSLSSSSAAAAASAETASDVTSVDSRFFSPLSDSYSEGAFCGAAWVFSVCTVLLIARVASKSNVSGHYVSSEIIIVSEPDREDRRGGGERRTDNQ